MNIQTAAETYRKATLAREARDHLTASRLFIATQREAKQCRSARREFFWAYGHAGAVLQAEAVLKSSADHGARSEAGRIKAESQHLFHGGL